MNAAECKTAALKLLDGADAAVYASDKTWIIASAQVYATLATIPETNTIHVHTPAKTIKHPTTPATDTLDRDAL